MNLRRLLIAVLFCVFSGVAFGMISGGIMVGKYPHGPAMFVGGIFGGVLGLLCSPMFMFANRTDKLFDHLVVCFVAAFPVVVLSALSSVLHLAVALDLLVIVTTFHILGKSRNDSQVRKRDFLLPAIILAISAGAAYIYDDLPEDAPSLIEIMGENDMSRHIAAARKLSKNYGKEPLITALHHKDARVRSRAAHFLAWFPDQSVFNELTKAAGDQDEHVRLWVAFSLGEHGDARALPTLLTLTTDPAESVRWHAQKSISKIQNKGHS